MDIDFARGRWAPATRAAYAVSWADFDRWCRDNVTPGDGPLPASPQIIADFLTARAETHSTSTLSGRLAAIVAVHSLYGREVKVKGTVIKDAWSEIRRRKGTANKPKAALVLDDIKKIMAGVPEERLLDRAVLLIGFASALRRSEIVALDIADLEFTDASLMLNVRRSKTDKAGKGTLVCILRSGSVLCPVAALERWIEAEGIKTGPVFRCRGEDRMDARTVANMTQRWGAKAGFDPRSLGAHSLRRGCITSMFLAGADIKHVMEHSRHKTVAIAMGYVQAHTAEANPALKAIQF